MFTRRNLIRSGLATGAALPLASVLEAAQQPGSGTPSAVTLAHELIAFPARLVPEDQVLLPWQQRIRRVAQTNMTEHDPAVMNIEEWADYWHAAKADIVYVSVTGILAFYPSKVPFHKHGKFLNNRDFFGECVAAARKRGMHVVARMSPDLNWPDALHAHPEWAMRNKDGPPQLSTEDPRLFKTCMFSTYMDDYVPAVMREINANYDVDCFYTNGWPPLGQLPECHCAICSKLPASDTPAYWRVFTERVIALWTRYDGIAKEKKAESFFFANSGGNVRGGPNLDQLGKILTWFQADNQGRTNADPAVWGCSLQGRVCNAVLDGKIAANVSGAYDTSAPGWRNASKNPEELVMWLNESLASGMRPYPHFVGCETGFGEDRRWQKVAHDYLLWTSRHDQHWTSRRTIANIGVVIGQGTQLLYPGPSSDKSRSYMRDTTNGIYDVMLRGRYAWDYVHEDRLDAEHLKKYRALILPNIAMLSAKQCQQLADYVDSGGSLMASFETSLYDEDLNPRSDFGLASLFGVSKAADAVGTNGNGYYARIENPQAVHPHPILEGFTETNWIAGAQNRIPLQPVDQPILTVVPGFVRYPPELAFPPTPHTNQPAVVLREKGNSRLAWISGDVERTYWVTGNGDMLRLLDNTIRWMTRNERVVSVDGPGFIEMFCWETGPGYAVHLLNYTNPDAQHGWLQSTHPIGAQQVSLKLPAGVRAKSVELLRAEKPLAFQQQNGIVHFAVPSIHDYEVAAITVA